MCASLCVSAAAVFSADYLAACQSLLGFVSGRQENPAVKKVQSVYML